MTDVDAQLHDFARICAWEILHATIRMYALAVDNGPDHHSELQTNNIATALADFQATGADPVDLIVQLSRCAALFAVTYCDDPIAAAAELEQMILNDWPDEKP
jgi:hypothetical protein